MTFYDDRGPLPGSLKVDFYAPRTSKSVEAELRLLGSERLVIVVSETEQFEYAKNEVKILPPVGRTPRRIRLANGAQCSIQEGQNEAFAQFQTYFGKQGLQRHIHRLEGSSKWIVAFSACTVLFVIGSYKIGLPAVAHHLAMQSPPGLRQSISNQSMKLIDEHFMAPSNLGEEDQAVLQRLMDEVRASFSADLALKLEVRSSLVGPNAFALPDGRIIFTDELYELLETEDQMQAVLAHEAGHVEEQHGLRLVIQNTGLALAISLILGDVSSWGGIASTLPTVLAQSAYSREFETEADLTAAAYLSSEGLSVEPMREALIFLYNEQGDTQAGEDLFSTHPSLKKRIEALDAYEAAE